MWSKDTELFLYDWNINAEEEGLEGVDNKKIYGRMC